MKMFLSCLIWPTAIVMLVLHAVGHVRNWPDTTLLQWHVIAAYWCVACAFAFGFWRQKWQTGVARGVIGGVLVYLVVCASTAAILDPAPVVILGFGAGTFFLMVKWLQPGKQIPMADPADHGPCTVYTADGTLVDLTAEDASTSLPPREGM